MELKEQNYSSLEEEEVRVFAMLVVVVVEDLLRRKCH